MNNKKQVVGILAVEEVLNPSKPFFLTSNSLALDQENQDMAGKFGFGDPTNCQENSANGGRTEIYQRKAAECGRSIWFQCQRVLKNGSQVPFNK